MSDWRFEILIDRGCRLCSREAQLMARLDRGRGNLRITDIGSAGVAPLGIDVDEAMRSIHGRWADGTVVHGVDVFRASYEVIGLGWLVAPTRLPGIRHLLDAAYRHFAQWRYTRRMLSGGNRPAGAPNASAS
ncbi:MAG: thiol-disulfide oxidoreductase DCC family protein [Planctomycetota bacterium]|jgi:predicted DCC family thiol-disulfide oxidoreductase YuxK